MNGRFMNVPQLQLRAILSALIVMLFAFLSSVTVLAEELESQSSDLTPQSPPQVDQQLVAKPDYSDADNAAKVLQVQFDLRKLGYYTGVLDGVLNSSTRDAIRSFQLEQMLDIDGELSDQLSSSLAEKVGRL
ncbi:MAG: peptidoglycan-binding domain-containing protein [Pseudomonadales bacterium]|nr:peptidoglycan-binding domain-containing protein [Pseudomonadales bacterium]